MIPFHTTGRVLLATVALVCAMATADAQQPVRIRGQVEKIDAETMQVKARDGATYTAKIADDARVAALVKASLADIKEDTFLGIGGLPQPDGSVKAYSIHIFLPAQRGKIADRTGPWDGMPGGSMTNAYVQSIVAAKDGNTLSVKYKDGEKKILVTPETSIVAVAAGDKSELKPGTPIFILGGEKQTDGTILVKALYFGRGVTPPM